MRGRGKIERFDGATIDASSIGVRLAPIDVGFDLRAQSIKVAIPADCDCASYEQHGERWIVSGDREFVVRTLRAAGYAVESQQCECGEITGVPCVWSGPRAQTVLVEHMPLWLRDNHTRAGNCGRYPLNGAVRLRLERRCAESLADEWTEILGGHR